MGSVGFSAEKYIEEQSKYILERIQAGDGRLYLEFGGKLVQDKHAMRVLPGFDENAKIKLLNRMKDQTEIIICIYAGDIISSKTRQDFGITYDLEVMRLIDAFRSYDLEINSVVVTRYENNPAVNMFINKLERRGIRSKRVGILYLEQRTSQYIWEGLENLSGNPCTSLRVGQRVVVIFEVKTAAFCHRVELMIGQQPSECATRGTTGTKEGIFRIVHLVGFEHRPKTRFVKWAVVRY